MVRTFSSLLHNPESPIRDCPSKPHPLRESLKKGKAPKCPPLHSWQLLRFPPLKLPATQVPAYTAQLLILLGHKVSVCQIYHPSSTTYKFSLLLFVGVASLASNLVAEEPTWELLHSNKPVVILFNFVRSGLLNQWRNLLSGNRKRTRVY